MKNKTAPKIPPGVFDLVPEDQKDEWKQSHLWRYVENIIHAQMRSYCYREIRTPIMERSSLFEKGSGESSDIVTKEMYSFEDKGGRELSLRPEGTPAIVRAYIEKAAHALTPVKKFFYIGPMFRYERPQAGRYRQHHQFGAEAFNDPSAEQDVEVIDLLFSFYQTLGLKNLTIQLNSLGDLESREKFKKAIRDTLTPNQSKLSKESQNRLVVNPLRILDSKSEQDKPFIEQLPSITEFLNRESLNHFEKVQKLLKELQIPYSLSPKLVRGLDYYNDTVFEVVTQDLGAQNSIGGGGRYDSLIEMLGGEKTPAVGFATGLERVIQTLIKQEIHYPSVPNPFIIMIPLGDEAKSVSFKLLKELREEGIPTEMQFQAKKLNKAMQKANALKTEYSCVIGDQEIKNQRLTIKEMKTGKTQECSFENLVGFLKEKREGVMPNINQTLSPISDSFSGMFSSLFTSIAENPNNEKQ